ncbi:MAG: carbon-nitrogen hydrolase family protein [Clostridiales bacterium]|nr:carbon-nitrogen hydrolase family protein [Clostridiales bacterium]
MNIATVTDKKIMDGIDGYCGLLSEGGMLIAGFGATDDFNYMSEFAGKTENLKKYVKLSCDRQIIFIAATVSRLLGKYYHTAIVIHKGNILGVSDQTHKTRSELTLGNNLKLYETDCGVLGILIGEDIFFPECALSLALGGAERLIYLSDCPYGREPDAMLKATAIFCGVNITALFSDFTAEYTNRGARGVIEPEKFMVFESASKHNGAYVKNRREAVYRTVLINKKKT